MYIGRARRNICICKGVVSIGGTTASNEQGSPRVYLQRRQGYAGRTKQSIEHLNIESPKSNHDAAHIANPQEIQRLDHYGPSSPECSFYYRYDLRSILLKLTVAARVAGRKPDDGILTYSKCWDYEQRL